MIASFLKKFFLKVYMKYKGKTTSQSFIKFSHGKQKVS